MVNDPIWRTKDEDRERCTHEPSAPIQNKERCKYGEPLANPHPQDKTEDGF